MNKYGVAIISEHTFQILIIGRNVLIESLSLVVIIIYRVFAIDAVYWVSGFNNNFKSIIRFTKMLVLKTFFSRANRNQFLIDKINEKFPIIALERQIIF